jgi:hypothetical protein
MSQKLNSAIAVIGIDIGKLFPHRWPRSARRHCAAAEVVAGPGAGAARQPAVVSDRDGGLRRCASSQSQAADAGTRRTPDASEIRAPVFKGAEERLPRCGGDRKEQREARRAIDDIADTLTRRRSARG